MSARVRAVTILGGSLLIAFADGAWALPGYSNLINSYCRAQGTVRVQYTDNGCTLCHHQGTFVSDAAHRVEPQWSEFELARSAGGDYSFFCPADGTPPQLVADAPASTAESVPGAAFDASAHASMYWMSLGYPGGHEATVAAEAEAGTSSATAPQPPLKATAAKAVAADSLAPLPPETRTTADRQSRLAKLRADLGVGRPQEAVWQELVDAVLAVGPPSAPASAKASSAAQLEAQLQEQQRRLAQRTAQLRAVNTALVRLNAQLNDRQQRLLAARLPALIGDSGQ